MELVSLPSQAMPQDAAGGKGMWEVGLGSSTNPATSREGLASIPPLRRRFDFAPFSQPAGNLPLDRKICSIQAALGLFSPLEFSAGKAAEY